MNANNLILPIGFGIIALRYLLHTLLGVPDNDEPELEE